MFDGHKDADRISRLRTAMKGRGFTKLVRVWQRDSFRLEIFATAQIFCIGSRADYPLLFPMAYRFFDTRFGPQPIFQRYRTSALYSSDCDSDTYVRYVLLDLCKQPVPAYPDLCKDYTERQLAWARSHERELSRLVLFMEFALDDAGREQRRPLALSITPRHDGSSDTVFAVGDRMTGERWESRFSDVDCNSYGPTAEALEDIYLQIEAEAAERRNTALAEAHLTCLGCNGVAGDQCTVCLGCGTVPFREVACIALS